MLAGLFGIGQQPTGDRDPYALRRQALGVVRILAERRLPVALSDLVEAAFGAFDASCKLGPAGADLEAFFFERMRGYFSESGFSASEVDAVLTLAPQRIDLVPLQLAAVKTFNTLPEAPSLAAANKRIGNILKRAGDVPPKFDAALLAEAPEKVLATQFETTRALANERYAAQDYTGMLQALASLKGPVDAFFDGVMVMSEDAKLRANRVALLGELQQTMNRIADISKLAG
jgi:glycyl-tRNA synthetase beta chain